VGYKLPNDLRKSLREPIGLLFTGEGNNIALNVIKFIHDKKYTFSVAVGDYCTKSLIEQDFYPNMIIYDGKTQRIDSISLDLTRYEIRSCNNPKGWILESAWVTIESAIAFSTSNNCRIAVRIDGEEDLLIIPAIISLPLGSIVIYGQPPITSEEGIVVAQVTSSLKESVSNILTKFEFHEEYIDGNNHN
jgi:uncharacterized protein (UPF0218 family)